MNFIRGTMIGVMLGVVAGAFNSDVILNNIYKGRKQVNRFKRRLGI